MVANRLMLIAAMLAVGCASGSAGSSLTNWPDSAGFLSWNESYAKAVVGAARVNGRVGGALDLRIVHTEHSYNYKLRATWLAPPVVRAGARLAQLREGLSDAEAIGLVEEVEEITGTVIVVEIDPREGSGVIPRDWVAMLGPEGSEPNESVRGESRPGLRRLKALSNIAERDYAYDRFWVVFPLCLPDRVPVFQTQDSRAQLTVRIYAKGGAVIWPIPRSFKETNCSSVG